MVNRITTNQTSPFSDSTVQSEFIQIFTTLSIIVNHVRRGALNTQSDGAILVAAAFGTISQEIADRTEINAVSADHVHYRGKAMKLHKFGGFATLGTVLAYILFVVYGNLVFSSGNFDSTKHYVSHMMLMMSSIFALVMAVAIRERTHVKAPNLSNMILTAMSASTVIYITYSILKVKSVGMINPAEDPSAWNAFDAISKGLYFAGGHTCGWSCLFAGCAILATGSFSRVSGWLLLALGILWVPNFFLTQIGFGYISPILVFLCCIAPIYIGIEMLRQKQSTPAANIMAAAK
jgi:hypothetical protein